MLICQLTNIKGQAECLREAHMASNSQKVQQSVGSPFWWGRIKRQQCFWAAREISLWDFTRRTPETLFGGQTPAFFQGLPAIPAARWMITSPQGLLTEALSCQSAGHHPHIENSGHQKCPKSWPTYWQKMAGEFRYLLERTANMHWGPHHMNA